jgi:hypothetical protein
MYLFDFERMPNIHVLIQMPAWSGQTEKKKPKRILGGSQSDDKTVVHSLNIVSTYPSPGGTVPQ